MVAHANRTRVNAPAKRFSLPGQTRLNSMATAVGKDDADGGCADGDDGDADAGSRPILPTHREERVPIKVQIFFCIETLLVFGIGSATNSGDRITITNTKQFIGPVGAFVNKNKPRQIKKGPVSGAFLLLV